VIQIVFLLFGVMYIGMNLVVDLLYAWADPRIRLAIGGGRRR
jgi:ABC-type dipeptide/oligopeptide/nickel transport system permease component